MAKKKISAEALGRLEAVGQTPTEAFLTAPSDPDPSPASDPGTDKTPTASSVAGTAAKPSGTDVAVEDPDLVTYTLTDLERILGLSHRSLLEYVKQGKLKARKIGTTWRVSRRNLLEYVHGTDPAPRRIRRRNPSPKPVQATDPDPREGE